MPKPKPIGIVEVNLEYVIAKQIGVFQRFGGLSAVSQCLRYHDVSKKGMLDMIIKYLRKHADAATISEDQLKAWDANFVNKLDTDTLSKLYNEAKYLEVEGLVDLTSQALSDRKNKTPEEVRNTFNTNTEEGDDELDAYVRDVVHIV